jgi:methylmalonyl-CoA/ethylmalonyl-CoA epimerase
MKGSGLHLHHVGVVVSAIEDTAGLYERALGARRCGTAIHDPLQRVRLLFVELPDGSLVELIEPASDDSPVQSALAKGGGTHHLCFEVEDLEAEMSRLRPVCIPTGAPKPAVAFGGRRVVFLLLGRHMLIELLEAAVPPKNATG